MAAFTSGESGVTAGLEARDHPALAVHQELGEVPLDVSGRRTGSPLW